jgi:hypothetical protein
VISKPIKNDASNNGINLKKKSSNKVPIIIFRCYIMGDEPIIVEQFFYGFEGVIMGLIMGSKNIMGLHYGSNISEVSYGAYILVRSRQPEKSQTTRLIKLTTAIQAPLLEVAREHSHPSNFHFRAEER